MRAAAIDDILNRLGLYLPSVIENSYKNFHAKGVDYLCLSRTTALTRKLYLFNGDVATFPEVVHPHDHRYAFKTRVIGGALRNSTYVPHEHGSVFNEFEWRTPLNGGSGFAWKRETKLKLDGLETLFKGEEYVMPHDGIHTIKVLENETALVLEQYEDALPIGVPTSTFTLDREPPSLTGLYEKFTADEVVERLTWAEPRLLRR